MTIQMTEMQKSALLEAGNIGSGHAAIALSQLMGKKIMIAVPAVDVLDAKGLGKIFTRGDKVLLLVSLKVLGDVKGIMLFSLEEAMAFSLCEIVMGQPRNTIKSFNDLEISALSEVGSIVTASYLNALSEMTGLSLIISTPSYYICKACLIEEIFKKEGVKVETLKDFICIRTEFIEADVRIEGYLLFMPADDAAQKILGALGV